MPETRDQSRAPRFVCCECNRVLERLSPIGAARCSRGHELLRMRPAGVTFLRGIGWACLLVLGVSAISGFVPDWRPALTGFALAISSAIAGNMVLAGIRYFRLPAPASGLARQRLGEAIGAFSALVAASLFVWL